MKVKTTEGEKLLWFYFVKICTNWRLLCRLIDLTTLKKLLHCCSKIPLQRTSRDLDF